MSCFKAFSCGGVVGGGGSGWSWGRSSVVGGGGVLTLMLTTSVTNKVLTKYKDASNKSRATGKSGSSKGICCLGFGPRRTSR